MYTGIQVGEHISFSEDVKRNVRVLPECQVAAVNG